MVDASGGPEVLTLRDVPEPRPGKREILVRVEVAGVNYHDVLAREGRARQQPPFVSGVEGAGVVVDIGSEVTECAVGQRVAWPFTAGSYAELVAVPVDRAVPVPENVSSEQAAALIAQGLTAHYLAFGAYSVKADDDILVHAAAGGVGSLLVQLAAHRGARVIGTTSTPDKVPFVLGAGASEAVDYASVVERVRDVTAGKGVQAVFDGVGAATFESTLACIARRGYIVLFGATSGPLPPFDLYRLHGLGSPYLTRPSLGDFITTRSELLERAAAVFELAAAGVLRVAVTGRFALADAAQAQRKINDRSSFGKTVLHVDANVLAPAADADPVPVQPLSS
ncbi:quinone oxidoreductase family protein [Mycolicibacterium sp. CBM1]